MHRLLFLLSFFSAGSALAQTAPVIKTKATNALTESIVIKSGTSLTINSGASITNNGTATGFGSGGTWGGITGTLSNQTDLNTALGLKANTSSLGALATLSAVGSATITDGSIALADIAAAAMSSGGAGAADAGKLVVFGATGGLTVTDDATYAVLATSPAAGALFGDATGEDGYGVIGQASNLGGVGGYFLGGPGGYALRTADATSGQPVFTVSSAGVAALMFPTGGGGGGRLDFYEDTNNGPERVRLIAPDALAADYTLTLPVADGTPNQALVTNGIGELSFATVGTNASSLSTGTVSDARLSANVSLLGGSISLTSEVTGTLPVANGGTGAMTHTANAVLIGNGTSAITSVAPSTSGNVLTSNGTSWTSAAPSTGLTIGTTAITSGTSGRWLYNNGGVLGEQALGTGVATFLGTPTIANLNSAVSDADLAILGANTFTAAQTIGGALSLGSTSTACLTLINTTAATNGTQQASPALVLSGNRWDTTSNASRQVDMRLRVLPIQQDQYGSYMTGSISLQHNNGGYTDAMSFRLQNAGQTAVCFGGTDWGGGTVYIGDGNRNFNSTWNGVKMAASSAYGWMSASSGDWTPDTMLMRDSAAVIQLGADANADATDQMLKAADGITGTDRNGGDLTLGSGNSTGTGTSAVYIHTPAAGSTGTTARTAAQRVKIDSANVTFTALPRLPVYTVATLPSTAATGMVQGAEAIVTDATAPTYLGALTGGGSVVCPVFYNGTAWVSH